MKHFLLATTALALLAPAVAIADDVDDHLAKGTRFYNLQDWASALKEFKQAYAIEPKPETLWAIAQTQRLAGDCRGAILTYKAYLRGASTAGANAAEDSIKQCQADLIAQQRAVDSINTPPPPVKPAALVASPAPAPASPRPSATAPRARRPWYRDPLGDALFAVGAVGLVGGGAFLVLGDLGMHDAAADPTWGGYHHATTRAATDQTIGLAAAAGGGACLGLAVWRFAALAGHAGGEHLPAIAVGPTAGGAVATYTSSF